MSSKDLQVVLESPTLGWALCVENVGLRPVSDIVVSIVDGRSGIARADLLPDGRWWGLAAGDMIELPLTGAPPVVLGVTLTWTGINGTKRRRRQTLYCEERPLPAERFSDVLPARALPVREDGRRVQRN